MADNCCYLVGELDLDISDGCIISINMGCSTETNFACGETEEGPTIGTISITGYATSVLHKGCPGRAGVNINWIRKYDCENDTVYFLFAGQGQSYGTSNVANGSLVRVLNQANTKCKTLNANASSGPSSLYTNEIQVTGYGLSYSGDPISFTTSEQGVTKSLGSDLPSPLYLQNFSIEFTPGSLPVANYSFVYQIT